MKKNIIQRAVSLLLALVCILGVLPLSAFAAGGLSSAPSSITQRSSDYMKIGGRSVRYKAASSVINNVGLPYVFDEQVDVPGFGPTRALCAYQRGTLGPAANGQTWNFKEEVDHPSLRVLLTFIYAHTYGDFTDAGNAVASERWNAYWSDIWFLVAQAMSWYYEHGILKDVDSDREGFIDQAAEELVAALKLYHDTYGQSSFIKDWSKVDIHTIIDSSDGGVTGNSAYDYVSAGVNEVLEHPEYYKSYHLWIYEWDKSQPWMLAGQSGVPMQRLLIAVPDDRPEQATVKLTVKKLEAGTGRPIPGVTFKVEGIDGNGGLSVTRETGADGTFTLTAEADDLTAGQYKITEVAVPEGYVAQTESQLVTVLPNGSANNVFTFYNELTTTTTTPGTGSIRKVNADNPTEGIPGAVIRITSVKLDEGGSYFGEFVTKEGGYILKEDLDFSTLPTGSYLAEEITPPEGFILSSDVSKLKQPFVWDGKTDVSLVFENSAKVRVQLKKVDESGQPLAGAIFVVLRDGQVIATEETQADGTITVSNVTEGYHEFREVSAPAGFDCDRSPVGVHVNAEDLQGEQTITVTKANHHKRSLTIAKRNTETGEPVPNTSFHVRGVNLGYENDVVTGANGKATLSNMPSGCYEITETDVPAPYLLDTNNRKTVWIDATKDQDVVVDFVNSTRPGLRLLKIDQQTGEPLSGVLFRIAEVNGGYDEQHFTNAEGLIVLEGLAPGAYTVREVKPKNGWVADDTVHTIYLEENKTTTLELSNLRKPDLFIKKVDSITGSPIEGVKFQIWRGSDDTQSGEYNDLGTFYTDAGGQIHLERVETGWYKIKELESAPGFTIKQPDTQEVYLAAGKDHTVTFENTPKNCIIVEKYDSVTGEALAGCTFQLRYLAGTSGTGGTVIGQKVTGKNGIAMWTGLEPGSYIVEEVDPADGYSIIDSSETVFLADNGEQSVITVRFDNMPDGLLLVRKVCATNPSITLQNAEFKITYADGGVIGDSNGMFRTDENGEIRISGLKPGKSVIVSEVTAPPGFIIDTQSQTIQIKEGRTSVLTFKNQPKGKLIIQKRDSQTNDVLPGAEFRITTAAGCEVGLDGVIGTSSLTSNGIFTTDSQGEIRISNLAPGAYVISEIKAPDGGYVIDTPSTNVVIGQGGDTQTVVIKNTRKGGLIVEKYDKVTKQPLAGAQFKIVTASGELVPDNEGLTSSNGLYTTDQNGQIVLSKLLPGTYIVSEEKAPDNYRKDPAPQTVVVNAGDTQTVRFYDDPLCTLTILKRDAVTKKPLKGAEFLVKDSSGHVIGPSNGLYTTGTDGTVTVTGLAPNSTIVVSEKRAPTGYILDETPKNIVVRSGVANSLIFDNEPGTTLIIRKFIEGTENEPLSGVCFKVVDGAGAAVGPDDGLYYTDRSGEIILEGIEPGTTVIAREVKTVEGYVLDGTPQDIKIVGGEVQQLTFWNKRAGELIIRKLDEATGKPLAGVEFELTYAGGGYVDNANGHLSSNGLYTTDAHGEIHISGVTGTIVAKETRTIEGYTIDPATQTQTVKVDPQDTQILTFYNAPKQTLTIQKYVDGTTDPIQGVTFLVTDSSGQVVGPNNGEYITDRNGRIVLTDLVPGTTITAKETKTVAGYVLDTTPQSILIKSGTAQTLTFFNKAGGGLELIKVSASDSTQRIPGTTFEIRKMDGALAETVTTGEDGRVHVDLDAGSYYAVETEAAQGFKLDATHHDFTVQDGKTTTLTVKNKPFSGILIHKTDSVTGKGIYGVTFLLYDSTNTPIGQYTSDNSGYVYIEGLTDGGRYYLRELENEGYIPDTQMKTVYVKAGETTLIEWKNTPITAQIQITKRSADYNPTNGLPAGTLLEGAVFEIRDKAGNLVDTIRSDSRGVAASKPLPLSRYTIKEVKAPANYGVSDQELTAYLEHAGEIVRFEVTNKALSTGVSITKTGPKQIMAGQPVRYVFSDIGNNSNVMLTSFYWRDTLPAEVRLDKVVTGTYNFEGRYKITYRVNGGEPRTLADSLSTSKNYTLAASATALGLASNERVTEVMFVFGQAPGGFVQVEKPMLYCTAVKSIASTSFVNVADVGGVHSGIWVQAVSRWVTSVYGKPIVPSLPKTGY